MIEQSRERGTNQRLERSVRLELGRELEAEGGHADTSVRRRFKATMTWKVKANTPKPIIGTAMEIFLLVCSVQCCASLL